MSDVDITFKEWRFPSWNGGMQSLWECQLCHCLIWGDIGSKPRLAHQEWHASLSQTHQEWHMNAGKFT